jgi:ECF sigma factor
MRFVGDLTLILKKMERGDSQAGDLLLSLAYDELRRLAAQKMAHESGRRTLQPSVLVHEPGFFQENRRWVIYSVAGLRMMG